MINESKVEKATEAFQRAERIRNLATAIYTNYLIIAGELQAAHQKKEHRLLDYERVEDYWEREFGIKAATGWNLVGIAQYVLPYLRGDLHASDYTRLVKLLPLLRAKEKNEDYPQIVEEWLHKAVALSPKDFDKEVLVAKGRPDQDVCQHEETELWQRCKLCGKWLGRTDE